MLTLDYTTRETLRSLTPVDAATLHAVVSAHRDQFDPWLRWSAAITSVGAAEAFIAAASARETNDDGFHLGLWREDELLGGVACWSIERDRRAAELGYWLVPDARGQGLAAGATRVVMDHLFATHDLERIEFRCLVENLPSRRLAERLGGTFEGIQRPEVLVGGACRDHALYAVTR